MFNEAIMENFKIGLQISLYGLGGVFAVLLLFYLLVRLMRLIAGRFPEKPESGE